ncbi:MAG TPA: TIR domain-containing protein [Gemmataceae bacterium]|nr:TIR domain-containing protein [Gemmataceae bacterium]
MDLFLCHNAADKEWVERLAEQIESETIDGNGGSRGMRVFFDKWDIDIGQNVVQRINLGLQQARLVAVIISPELLHGAWSTLEWSHIVSDDPVNNQNRLIPIFHRERSLDGVSTCELPAPFRSLNWIDFRSDADFDHSFRRLIRRIRGQPPERGTTRQPLAPPKSSGRAQRQPNSSRNSLPLQPLLIRGGALALGRQLIGRATEKRAIKRILTRARNHDSVTTVVIRGVGGVGKSALLNCLARDSSLRVLFPDGGLWVGVGESPDLSQLLRTWGQAVKLPEARLMRLDDSVGALRAKLQDRQMLLLVDDVWADHQAECFRVAGAGSVVLYSTRIADLADRLATSADLVYSLRGLKPKDGLDLLAELAPDVIRNHPRMCKQLVKDIDGLPLAIVVAGRMLHREVAAQGDVTALFQAIRADTRLLLEQPVPADMVDLLNQATPSVAAVLRRSTNGLDPQHRSYFARLGGFAPAPATFDVLFAAQCWKVDEPEAKRIARYFVDLGLIEVPKRGHFQIHPLMHALALREWDLLDE